AEAGEAQGGQGPTEATPAPAPTGARRLVGERGPRPRRLLRRARQHQRGLGLPDPGHPALVQGAAAPEPAHPTQLGSDEPDRDPVAPTRPSHAPLSNGTLRRQTPEAGAQCGNSARWDLCGGPPVRAVPTAIGAAALAMVSETVWMALTVAYALAL